MGACSGCGGRRWGFPRGVGWAWAVVVGGAGYCSAGVARQVRGGLIG